MKNTKRDRLITEINLSGDGKCGLAKQAPTLEEYADLVKGKICRWCRTSFRARVEHYDHAGGWEVRGFSQKQWLYIRCQKCSYQWNLGKLGIHR